MQITIEGPSLKNFQLTELLSSGSQSIVAGHCQRPHNKYRKRKCEGKDSAEESQSVNTDDFSLELWDTWFNEDSN